MKKLYFLAAILGVMLLLTPLTVSVFAQTEEEIDATKIIEESSETETKINEILSKLKENEDLQWFKTYVIPALSGAGAAVIGFILWLFPALKKRNEFTRLQTAYNSLKAAYKDIEENTSVDTIRKHIVSIFGEELKVRFDEILKKIEVDKLSLAETNAQAKATYQAVMALIEAAKITWRPSPRAVEALSISPTAETVKETELENKKLKDYIALTAGTEKIDEALKG